MNYWMPDRGRDTSETVRPTQRNAGGSAATPGRTGTGASLSFVGVRGSGSAALAIRSKRSSTLPLQPGVDRLGVTRLNPCRPRRVDLPIVGADDAHLCHAPTGDEVAEPRNRRAGRSKASARASGSFWGRTAFACPSMPLGLVILRPYAGA
jgi:hypothetical protein